MNQISVIVPVFNNATSLADLFEQFKSLSENYQDALFEFVFVDDGSTDHSYSILENLAKNDHRVRIIKLSRNFGSNAAILAGMGQAHGEAVVAIAADLQDPPELILEMINEWKLGNKVVLAARKSRKDGWVSDYLSKSFYDLFRRYAIKSMPESGFDFFLIDRKVCDLINNIQENNTYLMGLILWFGFSPKLLYYDRKPREKKYGRSMWTFSKKIKYFIDSFIAFSYLPVRIASLLGFFLSFLGLIYAIVIIVLRLTTGFESQGWASLMVVVLMLSGAQMVMIGILGEYMWRNLDETRKRPRFIIERIKNADVDQSEG